MNNNNKHHDHDQTHHLDEAAKKNALKGPVCGMDVSPKCIESKKNLLPLSESEDK